MPTILEYLTAVLMETIFHTSWWDYSKNRFNFQGRICLGASLGWGVFTVVLFYVLQPFVEWIVSLYSAAAGKSAGVRGRRALSGGLLAFPLPMPCRSERRLRGMDEVMDSSVRICAVLRSSMRVWRSCGGVWLPTACLNTGASFGNVWRTGWTR